MMSLYAVDFMKLSCSGIREAVFDVFLLVCVLMIDVDIS